MQQRKWQSVSKQNIGKDYKISCSFKTHHWASKSCLFTPKLRPSTNSIVELEILWHKYIQLTNPLKNNSSFPRNKLDNNWVVSPSLISAELCLTLTVVFFLDIDFFPVCDTVTYSMPIFGLYKKLCSTCYILCCGL